MPVGSCIRESPQLFPIWERLKTSVATNQKHLKCKWLWILTCGQSVTGLSQNEGLMMIASSINQSTKTLTGPTSGEARPRSSVPPDKDRACTLAELNQNQGCGWSTNQPEMNWIVRAVLSVFFHGIFVVVHMELVLVVRPSLQGTWKAEWTPAGSQLCHHRSTGTWSVNIAMGQPAIDILETHVLSRSQSNNKVGHAVMTKLINRKLWTANGTCNCNAIIALTSGTMI